mgnify:CR=1 FL=1
MCCLLVSDVREVFDLFDFWDGRDGLIGAEKVGDLLRCLGFNPTVSVVKTHGGTDRPGAVECACILIQIPYGLCRL